MFGLQYIVTGRAVSICFQSIETLLASFAAAAAEHKHGMDSAQRRGNA